MSATYMFLSMVYFASVVVTAMLMIVVLVGSGLKERVFRCFFVLLVLNLFVVGAELASGLLEAMSGPAARAGVRAATFVSCAASGLALSVFGQYMRAFLSLGSRVSRWFCDILNGLGAVMIVLAVFEPFTDAFYWLDASNGYHSGPLAWVMFMPLVLGLGVMTACILRYRRTLSRKELFTLLLYPVAPIVCYAVDLIFEGTWISPMCGTLTLFLIYISIQMDLERKRTAQQAELADSRIAIMLSQIQPHFLYNALSAIDNLFYTDPDSAHKAMYTFSDYLRGNMDSLSERHLIPFAQELEHTREYLHLEKLRFRDKLRIVYDIETDEFMLPVLTLQPIVENAVRNGVTRKPNGGTVTIRTRDAGDCFRITVEDDGVGFDPNNLPPLDGRDGRSHMGIFNVRGRLDAMCGGRLTINSAIGKGTMATIELPKG